MERRLLCWALLPMLLMMMMDAPSSILHANSLQAPALGGCDAGPAAHGLNAGAPGPPRVPGRLACVPCLHRPQAHGRGEWVGGSMGTTYCVAGGLLHRGGGVGWGGGYLVTSWRGVYSATPSCSFTRPLPPPLPPRPTGCTSPVQWALCAGRFRCVHPAALLSDGHVCLLLSRCFVVTIAMLCGF